MVVQFVSWDFLMSEEIQTQQRGQKRNYAHNVTNAVSLPLWAQECVYIIDSLLPLRNISLAVLVFLAVGHLTTLYLDIHTRRGALWEQILQFSSINMAIRKHCIYFPIIAI